MPMKKFLLIAAAAVFASSSAFAQVSGAARAPRLAAALAARAQGEPPLLARLVVLVLRAGAPVLARPVVLRGAPRVRPAVADC